MDIELIITDNIGLVYMQLHKFNRAYDDDAFSAGMEALWKAALTFESSYGFKFSTYASVCIYNAIVRYLRQLNSKKQLVVVSYNAPIKDEYGETILDTIVSHVTPESGYIDAEYFDNVMTSFDKVLNTLGNTKAKEVIEYWRNSNFEAKQAAIAEATHIAQPTVSKIISAFQHKLKKELGDDYVSRN